MIALLAIFGVFAVLLILSVAVTWKHNRDAIENFRAVEKERTR